MTTRKGKISVDTKDVLPIIKKWLYSEHDIFLRELVANASDAISKRAIIARNKNEEIPKAQIRVELDKKAKTITISDNGIGMSEKEVEKFIATLAFSGAQDFVEKLKEAGADTKDDIIGKFGLGFYSSFMVADKVEVDSLSMEKDAKPIRWINEGETDYSFTDSDRTEVGTSVILHVNDDSKEFLELYKLRTVLSNYCQFMAYPIELFDVHAKKDKDKEEHHDIINETEPLWKKDPTVLTDEDYKSFYRTLFPMEPDPLFWLHLNVDHPFTMQGILYFPKLNPNKPLGETNIKLYCKQVFVSDNVRNIIPDFLVMLKGIIDSTDIPLNVSRSALQGDPNIRKISNYIIKKVADSLKKLFKTDRQKFESVWEDIGLFVKYGITSDKKFDEMMREMVLFKNSEGKLFTINEYKESVPADYKEKLAEKIIYFDKETGDRNLRNHLLEEKIQTIETDSYIDPHFMQYLEMNKKDSESAVKFVSVDSEIEHILSSNETDDHGEQIKELFMKVFGIEKAKETDDKEGETPSFSDNDKLEIEIKSFKGASAPAYFKVDEQMKRFKHMTKSMGNTAFNMPVKKTLVVNPANTLIQNAYRIWEKGTNKALAEKICHHVQDLATISSQGLEQDEKEKFVARSQELISELSAFVV